MMAYSRITAALTATAMMTIATATAWAQDTTDGETEDQLLACDGITDMMEKLACFDSVVQGLKDSPEAPEADPPAVTSAEPDTPPPAEPEPTPDAPASSSPSAASAGAVTAPAAAPSTGSAAPAAAVTAPAAGSATKSAVTTAAPPETAAPATATGDVASVPDAPADTPFDPVDDFGRDTMEGHVEEEEPEQEEEEAKLKELRATVVRSWINTNGRFSVELDNGQVWRETEASQTRWTGDNDMVFGAPRAATGRTPKAGNTVEISEGRWSGYRMKIEGIRQAAWVSRTQ